MSNRSRVPTRTLRLRADALDRYPSLRAAALACGLTPTSVWRVARAGGAPSAEVIAHLVEGTGKPFDELFQITPLE